MRIFVADKTNRKMEVSKIYIQVKASERPPLDGKDLFFVDINGMMFSGVYRDGRYFGYNGQSFRECDYWLEEVNLPTEQDIENHSLDNCDTFCDCFEKGAKYVLNKIINQ